MNEPALTDAEREALAGVLATHRAVVSGDVDGWHVICHCGFRTRGADTTAHIADALGDWLAARVAEAVDRERAAWATKVADAWDEGYRFWYDNDRPPEHRDYGKGNPYRGLLAADDTEGKPAVDTLREDVARAIEAIVIPGDHAYISVEQEAWQDALDAAARVARGGVA